MNGRTLAPVIALVALAAAARALAAPTGTAFTYQGCLTDGGAPAQGFYDLRFTLCDAVSGGSAWGVLTSNATPVNKGLFTVTLDFGPGVFDGNARWIEIGVRTNGAAAFTPLAPRQPLTPTPYALQAAQAATAASVPAAGIGPGTANINISGNANTAISAAAAGSAAVAATAVTFSGTLAGDVTGTQGATAVERVRGVPVSATTPTASQHLRFDGTQWKPADVALGTDVSGTLADARLSSNVALRDASQTFAAANTFAGAVTATNPANMFTGAFTGAFAGNGAGLANLAAANLTGTVPDARLSANVALLDGNQTFTAPKTFSGVVTAINPANVFAGSFAGNGIFPWQVVSGTTQNAAPNTGYLPTNADLTTVMLPVTASIGDVVAVSGVGEGGWLAAAGANQSIPGANGPAGVTWTPLWNGDTLSRLASSADGRRLIGARWAGPLYTSVDGGASWTARETARYWAALASSADGRRLVAAVASGGLIYTSTDAGTNWTARGSSQSWTSVASSADGSKLAALGSSRLFTSTDAGTNWVDRGSAWGSMIASSADGNKLAWASDFTVYISADAGASRTERTLGDMVEYVALSADGTRLIAASTYNSRIWISADSGASWVARGSSQRWRHVASSADGTRLFAVAEFYSPDFADWTRCMISADAGAHWATVEMAGWPHSFATSADGARLVACLTGQTRASAATLYGAQGTAARLQYAGNGQWLPISTAQVTAGAVGEAQLAPALNVQLARLDGSPVFATPVTLGSFLSLARATVVPVAGATLAPAGSYLLLSPAGAVTLSGVTAVASATRIGDVLVLQGNSDVNTVTIANNANTRLAAATRVLGANDLLTLIWTGTAWTELSFTDN